MTEQQTPPKLKRYTVPDPDDIAFGDAWTIKAATGVDVMNPEHGSGEQIAALIWWAARQAGDDLPLSVAKLYTPRDVDFDIPEQDTDPDSPLDPDTGDRDAADPTGGPDTD